mgnify:CR=1 FL=1
MIVVKKYSALIFWPEQGRIDRIMPSGKLKKDVGAINSNGYKTLRVHGKMNQSHRLMFEKATGESIEGFEIDHINGVKTDNRISNLRMVNHAQNMQNRHKAMSSSISGKKGVKLCKNGKFQARIIINKKHIHLGTFETIKDAEIAYAVGAAKYHSHNPFASA